jgi:hypothetical protein
MRSLGIARGTADAVLEGIMPRNSNIDDIVQAHRVTSARREATWMDELEQRRRECVARARIDVEALRIKLAI